MRYGSVKHIALYYKAIPGMLRLLRQERTELEGNYYGLRGLACDGMPRGSSMRRAWTRWPWRSARRTACIRKTRN